MDRRNPVKRLLVAVVLVAGCGSPPDRMDLLCECFSNAAYEACKVGKAPAPSVCCGKCNNTGKVRSGDGLAIVDCPCPATCKCKCKDGKCAIKK
jgi:hypothetical protein